MIPVVEHSSLLTILYWLLMIPIAIVVLIRVTGFLADDGPETVSGAIKTILVMALAVFLTYDISGYVLASAMQDPQLGISFPPRYHYWNWIREPMSLKWHVLGFVPLIRYMPVIFGLCAGAIVQILLWKIPFRQALVVFVSQLIIDIFAMAMLSLVFSFFVGVQEGATAKGHPRQRAGMHANNRSMAANPGGLHGMQMRIENLGAEEGPLFRRLCGRWVAANKQLQPLYTMLEPVTRHLPLPIRDFLNGGGWLLFVPGSLALVWYWRRGRPTPLPKL